MQIQFLSLSKDNLVLEFFNSSTQSATVQKSIRVYNKLHPPLGKQSDLFILWTESSCCEQLSEPFAHRNSVGKASWKKKPRAAAFLTGLIRWLTWYIYPKRVGSHTRVACCNRDEPLVNRDLESWMWFWTICPGLKTPKYYYNDHYYDYTWW